MLCTLMLRLFSAPQLCCGLCCSQERDKLSVAAEGATSLRIKTQEVLAKEEQVRALLASNKLKLDNLLGTQGKGVPPPADA